MTFRADIGFRNIDHVPVRASGMEGSDWDDAAQTYSCWGGGVKYTIPLSQVLWVAEVQETNDD